MSATYEGPVGTRFRHNSDFSGEVWVEIGAKQIAVPAVDLLGFAAHYVRQERIRALEDADAEELLLGRCPGKRARQRPEARDDG